MTKVQMMKWGLYLAFLQSSILGIPLADMQTCELPNGDKIKIRTSQNWYLLKGINPHGSAWGDRKKKVWYIPNELFKFNIYLGDEGACGDYSVLGELIALSGKGLFLKTNHELVRANIPPHDNFPMLGFYEWKLTEQEELIHQSLTIEHTVEEQAKREEFFDKIDKQRRKQYGLDDSLKFSYRYFFGKFGNELWEEYGFELVQGNCTQSAGDCPITAVWQSHSTDNGKTWSKPIITKNAKLFVIGKSIKEQPGVAKDKGILKNIGWF